MTTATKNFERAVAEAIPWVDYPVKLLDRQRSAVFGELNWEQCYGSRC